MSPLQIVTTSALLLACVYLSLGAHIPTRRDATGVTVPEAIKRRTGTEAINAKTQADDYLKAYNKNGTETCSTLVTHLPLPCPKDVPGCNAMANVSNNLHYLLYMYSHVVGLIYQCSSTEEKQIEQLDLLEMMYYRFSHQMQRYLQADNHSCGNAISFEYPESNRSNISALMENFNYIDIANVILCHLRDIARSTFRMFGEENSKLRPYKLCTSMAHIECE